MSVCKLTDDALISACKEHKTTSMSLKKLMAVSAQTSIIDGEEYTRFQLTHELERRGLTIKFYDTTHALDALECGACLCAEGNKCLTNPDNDGCKTIIAELARRGMVVLGSRDHILSIDPVAE